MTSRRLLPALGATCALVAAAAPGASAADGARPAGYAKGEVVVRFEGQSVGREVQLPRGVPVGEASEALSDNPDVVHASPNYIAHAADFVPNDPGLSGAPGGWQATQWNFLASTGINTPGAWSNLMAVGRPGGAGTKVAVLDTGVAYLSRGKYRKSPDLGGVHFSRGRDFVGKDKLAIDENGHGTHITSTIAESVDNGVAVTGIAYGTRVMPVRVLDQFGAGEVDDIARGIRWAAKKHAQVINLSLEFDSTVVSGEIPEVISAIRYAQARNALVVAASGNEGVGHPSYPARADGVLSVGATTEHLCSAEYSNQGAMLMAPGGGENAVVPDDPSCRAQETTRNIFQLTFSRPRFRAFGYPTDYEGTSMSASHASGVAALVIASGVVGPNPGAAQVVDRMKQTARDLGPPGPDPRYGAGMIDAARATAR